MSYDIRFDDRMTSEEIEARVHEQGRVEAWETVPVDMQDSGAYDEGYGYEYCRECECVTEHDEFGSCIEHDYWS